MHRIFLTLIAAIIAAPAAAGTNLSLPLDEDASVLSRNYDCADGTDLSVQYVTAEAGSLALMQLGGNRLVFVSVIAASGVRYVNGARVWWTKGDNATLSDETSDAGGLECSVAE